MLWNNISFNSLFNALCSMLIFLMGNLNIYKHEEKIKNIKLSVIVFIYVTLQKAHP